MPHIRVLLHSPVHTSSPATADVACIDPDPSFLFGNAGKSSSVCSVSVSSLSGSCTQNAVIKYLIKSTMLLRTKSTDCPSCRERDETLAQSSHSSTSNHKVTHNVCTVLRQQCLVNFTVLITEIYGCIENACIHFITTVITAQILQHPSL